MEVELLQHDHEELGDLLHAVQTGFNQAELESTFAVFDLFWARLAVHIRAENLCLFPTILNAPQEVFDREELPSHAEVKDAIDTLRSDHNFFMDELASAVKLLREILAKPPNPEQTAEALDAIREQVNAVSLRLESHNALEEDQVYKWPGLILSASELQLLRDALNRELKNMPPRFAGGSSLPE